MCKCPYRNDDDENYQYTHTYCISYILGQLSLLPQQDSRVWETEFQNFVGDVNFSADRHETRHVLPHGQLENWTEQFLDGNHDLINMNGIRVVKSKHLFAIAY